MFISHHRRRRLVLLVCVGIYYAWYWTKLIELYKIQERSLDLSFIDLRVNRHVFEASSHERLDDELSESFRLDELLQLLLVHLSTIKELIGLKIIVADDTIS